jgi:hypothetical protein
MPWRGIYGGRGAGNRGSTGFYTTHKREGGGEKVKEAYKARRWIVEVAHSWLNRFRKLLVRYEKLYSKFFKKLTLHKTIDRPRGTGLFCHYVYSITSFLLRPFIESSHTLLEVPLKG